MLFVSLLVDRGSLPAASPVQQVAIDGILVCKDSGRGGVDVQILCDDEVTAMAWQK